MVAGCETRSHNTITEHQLICGGCVGLGAHSPRCMTQPGSLWYRLYKQADSLGDAIGPNDMEAANEAWGMAAKFKHRWEEERG